MAIHTMKTPCLYFSAFIALLLVACNAVDGHVTSKKTPPVSTTSLETLSIAPYKQKCTGLVEQKCLVVNGDLFYETIKGFRFEAGYHYTIQINKQQICNPNIPNDCPQDVGIYRYKLVRVLSKEKVTQSQPPVLEVIHTSHQNEMVHAVLVDIDNPRFNRLTASINPKQYGVIQQGDRLKIMGIYAESQPVQILNIRRIQRVPNPDKDRCEASKGNRWIPQGMAQLPACVTTYTDGGTTCTSSKQCQGKCLVTGSDTPAYCAKTNSPFGCSATIEAFQAGKGIMCVD